jgi:hypothetical protein
VPETMRKQTTAATKPRDVAPAATDVGTDDNCERRCGCDVDRNRGTWRRRQVSPCRAATAAGQGRSSCQAPGEQCRHAPGHGRDHGRAGARDGATAITIGYRGARTATCRRESWNGSGKSPKKRRRSVSSLRGRPCRRCDEQPDEEHVAAAASDSSYR